MAEHHELVAEMSILEQMGTQERQKLAKKRRLQQLKKWSQREKEWISKEKQLNKRLANTLHEENNGLNLKQYTTYSSNHRSKKKLQLSACVGYNNNNSHDFLDNNTDNDKINCFRSINGTELNSLTPNGRVHFNVGVMLLEAAARNDFDEVKRLLILGVSPDSVNHDGLTALHQCCIDASESMMNILLEFGANVDARDTEHWTPLHAACTCGHLNLVKILVESGANLLAVNGDGNMPFDICEDEATLDYIESQMVKEGITQEMIDLTRASTEMQMISDLEKQVAERRDLNIANDNGVTQLHIAAANGYLSVVKFLLKHGVNVNVCDNDQWRPLHGAACWGNEQNAKVIELLVEAGASLDAKTVSDETVFDLCDNAELLERLNQLKDELESKQASGIDRLKRTQSRTNSRVHSVRRTSVRDKNQISRREAIEEALLRVENSPTTATFNGATQTNDQSQNKKKQDVNIDNDEASENPPLSLSTIEHSSSITVLSGNTFASDQVDGTTSRSVDISRWEKLNGNSYIPIEQTDLGENLKLDDGRQRRHDVNEVVSRSQNSPTYRSNGFIPNKRKKMVKQPQIDSSLELTSSISADSKADQTATDDANFESNTTKFKNISLHSQIIQKSQMNEKAITVTEDQVRGTDVHTNNVTANCDSNIQLDRQQVQQVTQLAPINYTLSNLKKQRSDLRMRTTIIGGGSGGTTPNGHQVVLDPQPTSLPAGNERHRPGSPSLIFRKFSGEPSEVIGGSEPNNRRKWCCILI